MTLRLIALFAALIWSSACAPGSGSGAFRSPSQDYKPPPPSTADGRVVGADGVDPNDRLEEGPSIGERGKVAPGWTVDEKGARHDPKKRVGGSVDQKHEEEH